MTFVRIFNSAFAAGDTSMQFEPEKLVTPERIITFVSCCVGAWIFYELWAHDILTAGMIWKILRAEI
jgi:hypothetical protein